MNGEAGVATNRIHVVVRPGRVAPSNEAHERLAPETFCLNLSPGVASWPPTSAAF